MMAAVFVTGPSFEGRHCLRVGLNEGGRVFRMATLEKRARSELTVRVKNFDRERMPTRISPGKSHPPLLEHAVICTIPCSNDLVS